jgi:hypothetical protein
MRDAQINVQVPIMASRFSPWKIAIALVIYVVLCMLILIFSPPDYAAHDGLVQTSVPASAPASSGSATRQST